MLHISFLPHIKMFFSNVGNFHAHFYDDSLADEWITTHICCQFKSNKSFRHIKTDTGAAVDL